MSVNLLKVFAALGASGAGAAIGGTSALVCSAVACKLLGLESRNNGIIRLPDLSDFIILGSTLVGMTAGAVSGLFIGPDLVN